MLVNNRFTTAALVNNRFTTAAHMNSGFTKRPGIHWSSIHWGSSKSNILCAAAWDGPAPTAEAPRADLQGEASDGTKEDAEKNGNSVSQRGHRQESAKSTMTTSRAPRKQHPLVSMSMPVWMIVCREPSELAQRAQAVARSAPATMPRSAPMRTSG